MRRILIIAELVDLNLARIFGKGKDLPERKIEKDSWLDLDVYNQIELRYHLLHNYFLF
jgi:hypothetical protein